MIAEIIKELYDFEGRPTGSPSSRKRKKLFLATFPMERYVSQPLSVYCKNIKELRKFLRGCSYVSDKEQFNKEDYWMPPEEFETRKKGDCDDFALWTWRQLIEMGYKSRYVVGRAGKYGEGHAWVTMEKDGKQYLVEPLMYFRKRLPRLSVARYEPKGSVGWDGKSIHYFIHEKKEFKLPILKLLFYIWEWLYYQISLMLKVLYMIILLPYFKVVRKQIRKTSIPQVDKGKQE
ncbi:MAG: transglutaminase-like cysteine peptidase [Sedimentisphaerales bacterium]|nr:transglutaminase-like cysteine peptidase [Sedimentisphaerales bacterium]